MTKGEAIFSNLLAFVLKKKASDFNVRTRTGVLAGFFSRNELESARYKGFSRDMISETETEVLVRAILRSLAMVREALKNLLYK